MQGLIRKGQLSISIEGQTVINKIEELSYVPLLSIYSSSGRPYVVVLYGH